MNTDILFEGESEKSRESFCMKLEILEIIADMSAYYYGNDKNHVIMDSLMMSVVEASVLFDVVNENDFKEFCKQFVERMVVYNNFIHKHNQHNGYKKFL